MLRSAWDNSNEEDNLLFLSIYIGRPSVGDPPNLIYQA